MNGGTRKPAARGLRVNRLAVLGVGLIGGSVALALKQARVVRQVSGFGRTRRNLTHALRSGVIDEIADTPAQAVAGADLVLIATPVGQMPELMKQIAPHLTPDAVVTDAGSTKQDVIACARRHLARHLDRFVPGHPIAGAEKSGAAAAQPALFRDHNVILTPDETTAAAAVRKVTALWRATGATVVKMDAPAHDRLLALVSHLPHVLSYALVDDVASRDDARRIFGFAAGGFRDFTRIAGSSPEMWSDICVANRDALLVELGVYQEHLNNLRRLIKARDRGGLAEVFEQAREARKKLLLKRERRGVRSEELRRTEQ
ncbi:MAG TPA: prephenate dehydrogenase/arogenate dehydrogenase family protein [Burkholderiales bacterium]|jgi:prephenate dehydrogenase|nr:prephenate dehydrogenase/arogenate dehydrogenase family protein [Burkholderiales bacterium]